MTSIPMQPIAARKRAELEIKLAGLRAELERWEKASAVAGAPFARHHSQIRAAAELLRGLCDRVVPILPKREATAEQVLAKARNAQWTLLAVRRIWEYFRAKLAQRYDCALRDTLAAADELAWLCYAPLRKLRYPDPTDVRAQEPPLVFLNGGLSPFALSRGAAFEAEPGTPIDDRVLKKGLSHLPVPVIGVPWSQVAHLPDALVIAHEVGHVVENDLGLRQTFAGLVADALANAQDAPGFSAKTRRSAWRSWRAEVVADLFGCAAAGPAFVSSLIDHLAASRDDAATELRTSPHWEDYPTLHLRVLLNLEALRRLGFSTAATHHGKQWGEIVDNHRMEAFENDIAPVVEAVLETPLAPLGATSLRDAIGFTSAMAADAERTVARLEDGASPDSRNVRALFAAARLAYDRDPETFTELGDGERIRQQIVSLLSPDTRAGEDELSQKQEKSRRAGQRHSSEDLFNELMELAEP